MTPNDRDPEEGVPLDRLFRTLSRPPRRRILESLREQNPRTGDEFAEVDWGTGEERDARRMRLRHQHLPYLDEVGLIDWDPETDTVTRGSRFEEVRPLLELMDGHRDELPYDWP